ncbi:MAG: helix-turn-helix transcriptional regulator, partial [Clostridium sp.]
FKNEISSLENEKANLIKSNNLANDDLLNINLISNLLDKCSNIDALSKDEQRQIINTIIDVIYWYGDDDKIKIKFYGISDNDDIDTICYDEPEQPSINRLFFSSHSMCSMNKRTMLENVFNTNEYSLRENYEHLSDDTPNAKLKKLRLTNGLTLKQLSDITGMAQTTLSNYENHRRKIPTNVINKICSYFNVDSSYFI